APEVEAAGAGLLADVQPRVGLNRAKTAEQWLRASFAIAQQGVAQCDAEAPRGANLRIAEPGRRHAPEAVLLAAEQPARRRDERRQRRAGVGAHDVVDQSRAGIDEQ